MDDDYERQEFSGAWTANWNAGCAKRTILITGTGRGGTSFAASAFLRLGIPFARPGHKREISRRTHEHRTLRDLFKAEDREQLRAIAAEFSQAFPIWGWKLPQIHNNLELILECIENPHFVFVFKEPVSVAFRRTDILNADFTYALENILQNYLTMTVFARQNRLPVLFVGYDSAMASMAAFLAQAAAFAGVEAYDSEAVIAEIRADGQKYYP